VTARFLRVKLDEYEILKRELEELQREASRVGATRGASEDAE
jgi:hypothetical protein